MKTFCVGVLLLLGCGQVEEPRCRPTLEHVRLWPGTVDGPARLAATVRDTSQPLELRQAAAVALAGLQRGDVAPFELLSEALEPDEDGAVAAALVDPVVERLATEHATQVDQVLALELALWLHPRVDADARERLSTAVMAWYTTDVVAREGTGATSLTEAVEILGEGAEEGLLAALAPRRGVRAMTLAAEALAAREDEDLARRAAEQLRTAEAELVSPAFLTWLQEEVRSALSARGPVEEERVRRAAEANREAIVLDGLLTAMHRFCAVTSVADQLMELAGSAPAELSSDDAAERRARALQALEGCAEARHAEALIGMALDDAEPLNVRDYAFDRAAEVGGPIVTARLWAALEHPAEPMSWRLRWRIGALVLAAMDASELPRFLAALPPGEYAPEQLSGFAEAIAALEPGDDAARAMLDDRRWFVRILGLYVHRASDHADAPAAAARLSADRTPLVGSRWAPMTTVGDVARSAE